MHKGRQALKNIMTYLGWDLVEGPEEPEYKEYKEYRREDDMTCRQKNQEAKRNALIRIETMILQNDHVPMHVLKSIEELRSFF